MSLVLSTSLTTPRRRIPTIGHTYYVCQEVLSRRNQTVTSGHVIARATRRRQEEWRPTRRRRRPTRGTPPLPRALRPVPTGRPGCALESPASDPDRPAAPACCR